MYVPESASEVHVRAEHHVSRHFVLLQLPRMYGARLMNNTKLPTLMQTRLVEVGAVGRRCWLITR